VNSATLPRVLEPEVMDSAEEARDYDAMDHAQVNRAFVADLLAFRKPKGRLLDLGTGTALIPIELCRQYPDIYVVAVDAAHHMLKAAQANVDRAGLSERIQVQHADAKHLPFEEGALDGVMSNSIVHHIPEPLAVLSEIGRVVVKGGAIFIRDLLRPRDDATVKHLVKTYAGDANAHQQKMFEDSLRAALTLDEIQALVGEVGYDPAKVRQNSDRHWTWAAP
jgi:ubiquinone/menaquinone biosynthesis C-methylase UbiE